MEYPIELPKQFNIQYDEPQFGKFISFRIYREPDYYTWNGYYKGERIRLWFTGEYWVVAGYLSGAQACYYRTNSNSPDLTIINKLVQCACYYIDVMMKQNKEQ